MKFYYDESEHSRKINENTIVQSNYYDNFVTAIVGWSDEDARNIEDKYLKFEEKYSARKSQGELKSTTLKMRQLQYGFASLTRDNLDFVSDFLDLFDEKIKVYFSVNSKIEYIIDQLFEDYENHFFQDADALRYSLVKSLVVYQPKEVIRGIYQETDQLVEIIKEFYKARIEENKKNPRLKEAETAAYQQALILLDTVNSDFRIEWDYYFSFAGFKKFLEAENISTYTLTLDREGEEQNTKHAATDLELTRVEESDSKECVGIRMADMFAGILSKLLKCIREDHKYKNSDDALNKKLFSEQWFNINNRQLAVYKKLDKILKKSNTSYGVYRDDILSLEAVVSYFSSFETVDEIKQISVIDNKEFLNIKCVESLQNYYGYLYNKIPLEFIEDTSLDYFIDKRGVKTYYDANKQPLLNIKQGSHKYKVLNVGRSALGIPTVDIEENGKVSCYRLPVELSDWVLTNLGFAQSGEKLFPSEVVFSKNGQEYGVDFVVGENFKAPFSRVGKKVGRNETCPCGSGKKYKKCCGVRS